MPDRACVILIKGPHNCGKSLLLKHLYDYYKKRMDIIYFNLEYNEYKKTMKQNGIKTILSPLQYLRKIFEEKDQITDIIALDHLEELYIEYNSLIEFLITCIQKSREIYVNDHHLIILITFPRSEENKSLESTINRLPMVRGAIKLINL